LLDHKLWSRFEYQHAVITVLVNHIILTRSLEHDIMTILVHHYDQSLLGLICEELARCFWFYPTWDSETELIRFHIKPNLLSCLVRNIWLLLHIIFIIFIILYKSVLYCHLYFTILSTNNKQQQHKYVFYGTESVRGYWYSWSLSQICSLESTRPDFIGVLDNLWSEIDDLSHSATEASSFFCIHWMISGWR
jgi:hypothetical protein